MSKADKSFSPEGPKGPRAKMFYLLETRGMNFFLLKGGKTISAQLNYVENAFLYVY